MKIDVGCGHRGTKFPGFMGVDSGPLEEVWRRPESYIQCDVTTEKLPFEDNSVEIALCMHLIEHLNPAGAGFVLAEICRVLKPEGEAYIATPNLYEMAKRYVDGDGEFYAKKYRGSIRNMWRGPTLADKFLDSIIGMGPEFGHKYAYDGKSLCNKCKKAGLRNVKVIAENPYMPGREDHEVIVVARKR